MYKIQTLNKISANGLSEFPLDCYEVADDLPNPVAMLVRSFNMHQMNLPLSLSAVARAGAGTNNVPVQALTERGVVVFNTPGANANAVKELVLLAMLASSRNILAASAWVKTLMGQGDKIPELAEKGKSQFIGPELAGKTLGVIGLGAIGVLVANSAVGLGMRVIGYDPFISVDGAWHLNRDVIRAENLESLVAKSDYITVHVPLTNDTVGMIDAAQIKNMKAGVRLINLAREELAISADILSALSSGKVASYVSDFASEDMLAHPKVLCLPHLGASTPEAEENCARMAAKQVRDFLEKGAVANSVNFPECRMEAGIPAGGMRLCVANRNEPNMIGQMATVLADEKLNVSAMVNQNRNDLAYNLIDVEGEASPVTLDRIVGIDGVLSVRVISARG
ncbi:phosphoglycerate dehydrogenase [Treponema endosymbiont of Eucomonympha sp.]|uniref:phosphoglycerate dehydrogenase n=1 Tax=Treponema endosymbiont of Eucomonympha sp. TaxID=1580831 RepID=UPI000751074D|nr:phosphoglycerate dehydrogenase [Treponema endosymbiont of Eucomonympha sp.]